MSILLVASMAMSMNGAAVTWADARDFNAEGLEVREAGSYTVWAWAKDDDAISITLGAQKFDAPPPRDPRQDAFAWRKAGQGEFAAGVLKGSLGSNVATVVLAKDPQFDPVSTMAGIRTWDKPEAVVDRRAVAYRDTNSYQVFPHFHSREDWERHAEVVRRRLLIGSGLFPLPERTPLNARIFDTVQHEDYITEKVVFESRPGFLVTGNLYRPIGDGPFPAIINPHGHWENGRLENGERGSVPGRCITFARMGIVAFSYDMVGYVDSKQLPHGLNEDKQKLWGIHNFAFQLWNSVRALDFVESLPYVDKERLGCTGASGGGTQTFTLTPIDERVKVSAPVNMISDNMQGGCPCENAPLIRLDGISNMDIGAAAAPRPMLMVAATGDWTFETPRVEYPAIRSVYELYGAPERLEMVQIQAEHNYNQPSREAVYRFFGKWLLNQEEKYRNFTEPAFTVNPDELRIYPGEAKPEAVPSGEEILARTVEANRAKWNAILPRDQASLAPFREQYGVALFDVFAAELPHSNDLEVERARRIGYREQDGYVIENLRVHRRAVGDTVPMTLYRPADAVARDTVVIVHGEGKAALADPSAGGPGELVRALLDGGRCVVALDAFLTGEHHSPFALTERAKGGFPDTFEPTDTACRVQDVLTTLAYVRSRRDLSGQVDLVGLDEGGLWALFASALDGRVTRTVVDANRFDNESDDAWVEAYYVPCLRSVGDVATAAAMIAPRALFIANTGEAFKTDAIARMCAIGGGPYGASAEPLTTPAVVDLLGGAL